MKPTSNVLIAAAMCTGLAVSGQAAATSGDASQNVTKSDDGITLAQGKNRDKARGGKGKMKAGGPAAKGAKAKGPSAKGAKGKKAPKPGKGKDAAKGQAGVKLEKADAPAKGKGDKGKGKGKDKDKGDKGKAKGKDKDKERGKSEGKGKGKKLGHLDTADKEAAHHARRMAQIDRIEAIATEKNNDKLKEKVAKLRELENKRHEKATKRLGKKANEGGEK